MSRTIAVVLLLVVVLIAALLDKAYDEPETTVVTHATTTTWAQQSVPDLGAGFDRLVAAMKPKPRRKPLRHAATVTAGVWDRIAQCESGGRWDDTRGIYEGGVHFLHDTWVKAGGRRYAEHAYQATREQQIEIAQSWLEQTNWSQWPSCSRQLGLR